MRKVLYRKYRPGCFADFVGQDEIQETLVNSIKTGKISHAYLFSGPRGTGKTSAAKLLAKAVNCENFETDICNKCDSCKRVDLNSVDIIEIDAASNNGVDEIRELKSKINLVPSELKYKVYIIDEVHMLTTGAFNALLKTLEEPPGHVIFILATTELYKVPVTIVSRCQTYQFKRISDDVIVKKLVEIAKLEKIKIDKEVLETIAEMSNGGLRDSIGLLDKCAALDTEKITIDSFLDLNGFISNADLNEMYQYLVNSEIEAFIEKINKYNDQGYNINNFLSQLLMYLRKQLFVDTTNKSIIIDIMYIINDVILNNDEKRVLLNFEIKLLKLFNNKQIISREIIVEKEEKELKKPERTKKPENSLGNTSKSEDIISREIISDSKEVVKKEEKIISREIIEDDSLKKLHLELISTRINNVFCNASKEQLNEVKKHWLKIKPLDFDTINDRQIAFVTDGTPVAASDEYLIIQFDYESLINKSIENMHLIEAKLAKKYNITKKIVPLLKKDWLKQRKVYIDNMKNDFEYKLIDDLPILKKIKDIKTKERKKINDPLVKGLIDIVGSDTIEFE